MKLTDNEIRKKMAFLEGAGQDHRYRNFAKLKDDPSTLRAVLVAKGLLRD